MNTQASDRSELYLKLANYLTIARIVLSPVLAILVLYKNPWWFAFIFAWIIGSTDKLDGILARQAEPTRKGAFLDTVADKVLLLFAGFAVAYQGDISWWPMVIIAVREVAMMVYRMYWAKFGLALPARKSGKYKAVVQGVAITSGMLPPLEDKPEVVSWLMWIAVAFTLFSAAQYIIDGRSALSTSGSAPDGH